jgi:hypothetical protein
MLARFYEPRDRDFFVHRSASLRTSQYIASYIAAETQTQAQAGAQTENWLLRVNKVMEQC